MKCNAIGILAVFLFACTANDRMNENAWNHDAPLYATYAAALERSEFLIDQGYEFHYYELEKPLTFSSQKGGTMGLVFRIDGKLIQNTGEYFKSPQIHESFPDIVSFSFFPEKGIEVKGTFLVHSSSISIQEFELINHTERAVSIELIPFVSNSYRTFKEVKLLADQTIEFFHEKYPDSWSINQEIPYEDSLQNLWVFSEKIESWEKFSTFSGENPQKDFGFDLDRNVSNQVFGRAFEKGERLLNQGSEVRLRASPYENPSFILTENSPIWGSPIASIDHSGLYRIELSNLPESVIPERLSLTYFNLNRQIGSQIAVPYPHPNQRIDFDAGMEQNFEPIIKVESEVSHNNIKIFWQNVPDATAYQIYKRSYPGQGYYELLTEVQEMVFQDIFDPSIAHHGYVILPVGNFIGVHSTEVYTQQQADFNAWLTHAKNASYNENLRVIAVKIPVELNSKKSKKIRVGRGVQSSKQDAENYLNIVQNALSTDFNPFWRYNENLFSNVPELEKTNEAENLLYKSAWNMMRQVMYPPEGKSPFNYYVFSREPTWGWGHGGQVFHESISMLAYAYLDPESAMNSQRVFAHRQYENGYINYRTGSYLDEIIDYNGQLISSAPWYSWLNWEIFEITQDRTFLKEMYASSKKFYSFYISERDSDGDGLLEWGGHAVLESVRDALVAVWDEVGWPSNFESIDLNCMMVMEAKALEKMALELGLTLEAAQWRKDHETRAALINHVFWDEENGFYYNVDKENNSFTFRKENDLKRDEIIGFLPLWAGVADGIKAERLIQKLQIQNSFGEKMAFLPYPQQIPTTTTRDIGMDQFGLHGIT